ncbi:hypothetical protein SSS_02681 [Sarcoptes scabiei]|uniref:Uncharacterized protein n=1 Tax=Sarcoptes scabiei TaxID=52283 RepID=A0A834R8I3_SARSC|nr:hypothetical protein SSS_02681 [Sarcoptes scabiei]
MIHNNLLHKIDCNLLDEIYALTNLDSNFAEPIFTNLFNFTIRPLLIAIEISIKQSFDSVNDNDDDISILYRILSGVNQNLLRKNKIKGIFKKISLDYLWASASHRSSLDVINFSKITRKFLKRFNDKIIELFNDDQLCWYVMEKLVIGRNFQNRIARLVKEIDRTIVNGKDQIDYSDLFDTMEF